MARAAGVVPAPAWRAVWGELPEPPRYRVGQARPSTLHAGTARAGAGHQRPGPVFHGAAPHVTEGTMMTDEVQVAEAPKRRRRKRGEGGLYRRPGTAYWWMAVPYRGRMLRESTGETDKKKAQAKLKAKRDEVAAARGGFTTVIGPEHRA